MTAFFFFQVLVKQIRKPRRQQGKMLKYLSESGLQMLGIEEEVANKEQNKETVRPLQTDSRHLKFSQPT